MVCVLMSFVSFGLQKTCAANPQNTQIPTNEASPWPLEELLEAPEVFSADQYQEHQVPGVRALLFAGINFRGAPTKVFAYYSAPVGEPPAGGWPAIVIAHGGGGMAYAEYVKMWNSRGYAAISMDFYGKLPAPHAVKPVDRQAVEDGFPYDTPATDKTEEWSYQVVSTIILANSLLRSFPEINPDKIGLVGTSWGGIHSSIAGSLDSRFKFVVAIYGCGFLSSGDDSVAFHQIYKDALPWWDPSHFLPQAKIPIFWVGGTNDGAFSADMWQKSINVTPTTIGSSLVVNLGHSDEGQTYAVAANVAKNILREGPGFVKLERPEVKGREVSVKYTTEKPLTSAELNYTTDKGGRFTRVWQSVPAKVEEGVVTATLSENATAFFINVYDDAGIAAPRGSVWPISSEYIELP